MVTRVTVKISTENAAFEEGDFDAELASIFEKMAERARVGAYSRPGRSGVLDTNGNSVASVICENVVPVVLTPGDGIFEDDDWKERGDNAPDECQVCGTPLDEFGKCPNLSAHNKGESRKAKK